MSLVKLFDPFTRLPGTSLAAFSTHWNTQHAGIAKGIPQIKHYIQSHRQEPAPAALGAPLGSSSVDGSSETWYTSPDDLAAMVDEAGARALLIDEELFMDLQFPRHPVLTREQVVDGHRPDDAVKVLLFTRRPREHDRDAFLSAWSADHHRELGRAVGAIHHVLCPRVEEFTFPNADVPDDGEVPFDGVRELWFRDAASLEAGARSNPEAWARLVHPPCVDAARSFALFARERVIIA